MAAGVQRVSGDGVGVGGWLQRRQIPPIFSLPKNKFLAADRRGVKNFG